ncbi:MAG TPA: nuclear transport factor 2 family protein, partial [Thermoleophilaceae bacterium]
PRASLAGAEDRRARSRTSSRDGCTVHLRSMTAPSDIVRQVSERWNARDFEGLLELYHDDVSVQTGEHWPERHVLEGKAAFRESIDEWLSVWESIAVETDHVESFGDRVVARGAWLSTGRMSGVEGTMPIHIVFTVRDGKIARVDWCQDHEQAVAAARDA